MPGQKKATAVFAKNALINCLLALKYDNYFYCLAACELILNQLSPECDAKVTKQIKYL